MRRGVGSAREISRLTETDLAYRWISWEMRVSHQLPQHATALLA
jgi:hypothetical protein